MAAGEETTTRMLARAFGLALAVLWLAACDGEGGGDPWIDDDTDGVRILPLGDSITQGDAEHVSYRYALWTMLVDEGHEFDFVGTMYGNYTGDPAWPDYQGLEFDRDHEGHWGWHVNQLIDELPAWLDSYDPQIVLLHAGTNDAFADQPATEIAAELGELIEVLRDDVPEVVVLLARPIPTTSSAPDAILEQLSAELDDLAQAHDTVESPIVLVDQRDGFDADVDTYDGLHPNAVGEQKMASRWLEALLPYL